jgi:hypothetical protein
MPVSVEIPVRLRIDPQAADTRLDDIEEALSAALRRALANSRKQVLEPRGGYLAPLLEEPQLMFTGDGLAALSPHSRDALEACVRRALAAALRDAELLERDPDVPDPLGEAASERVDDERHLPLHGRYLVPAYQGGGNQVPLPVEGDPDPTVTSVRIARWQEANPDWGVDEWIYNFVNAYTDHPPALGPTDWVGMIFRLGAGYGIKGFRLADRNRVVFSTVEVLDGVLQLVELHTFQSASRGLNLDVKEVVAHLSTDATMSVRWLPEASSVEGRRRVLTEFERNVIADALEPERARLLAQVGPQAYEAELASKVEATVNRLAEDEQVKSFAVLDADGEQFLIRARSEAPGFLGANPMPLVPYVSQAYVTPDEAARLREQGMGDESDTGLAGGEGGEGAGVEGGAGGPPGFVLGADGQPSPEGSMPFPTIEVQDAEVFLCEPFLGEPSVQQLGADGERLRQGINAVAARLAITPCEFAGQFALHAAGVLAGRAKAVGQAGAQDRGGILEPPAGVGNLGTAEFTAAASPARQLLRHLAASVPVLNDLSHEISSVYLKPEHRGAISGWESASWVLRYASNFERLIINAAAYVYGATCQVTMAQLLHASRDAIYERQLHLEDYTTMFEQVLLPRLERVDELMRWRNAIRDYEVAKAMAESDYGGEVAVPSTAWRAAPPGTTSAEAVAARSWPDARDALLDAVQPSTPPAGPPPGGHKRGEVVDSGAVVGVDDGTGRIWTTDAIEAAIIMRRGTLESIDPLIKQFADLPEVMERLRGGRDHVKSTLDSIMNEMLDHNLEILGKVQESWEYSFRAGRISPSLKQQTIPGTGFQLQGIHLIAHQAVGDAFGGHVTYTLAIRSLFEGELNRALGLTLIEFGGLILVAIICPPLAVALGFGTALYHYAEAVEREHLYQALINPELVLSRAEVEAELFAAEIGVALAFLPEVGNVLKGGSAVVRTVAKEGLVGAAAVATTSVREALSLSAEEVGGMLARSISKQVAEQLKHGLLVALVREIATMQIAGKFIEVVMRPIIGAVEREVLVTGAQGGLDRALEHKLALLPRAEAVSD